MRECISSEDIDDQTLFINCCAEPCVTICLWFDCRMLPDGHESVKTRISARTTYTIELDVDEDHHGVEWYLRSVMKSSTHSCHPHATLVLNACVCVFRTKLHDIQYHIEWIPENGKAVIVQERSTITNSQLPSQVS